MPKIVAIENVARIEGHAAAALYLDNKGKLEKAEYIATEPSRGFDVIFKNKHASEVPGLAARICGICYSAHTICASKALENAWGIEVPGPAKGIRELLLYANTLSSHALHLIFLAWPGLLIDGASTITDLQKKHPDLFEAGIKVRMVGQDISEIVSGRKVHTVVSAPGGVLGAVSKENQDKILEILDSITKPMAILIDYAQRIVSGKKDFMISYGKIETHFLSIKQGKRFELYDGPLELIMNDGQVTGLKPDQLLEKIVEEEKEYSYVRHPYITALGPEKGQFRVGSLARIQNASWNNQELRDFKKNFGDLTQSTMGYDIARIPEMSECIKEMKAIVEAGLDEDIKVVAQPKAGIGVAVVEAPRGLLLHRYETDNQGIIMEARVIAPTTFHQGSIERSVYEAANTVLGRKKVYSDEDKTKIEQVIRAYDPCMSCAGATQLRVIKREPLGGDHA